MNIIVTQGSDLLPVSLTTALRHLRVLQDDADLVQLYLQAATEQVEDYTGRALQTKSYRLVLDGWPTDWSRFPGNVLALELRRSPLLAIQSVKYYAPAASTLTTWDAANYRADTVAIPGRLCIVDGVALPDTDSREDAIQIDFTAGYGVLESTMNTRMQMAILYMARHFYDNRVPVVDAKMVALPLSYQYMLRALKVDSLTS